MIINLQPFILPVDEGIFHFYEDLCVCAPPAWQVAVEAEEGFRSPGTRVTVGSQLVGAENQG